MIMWFAENLGVLNEKRCNFITFIMILHFSLLSNKIDTFFYFITYLTCWVFNVIRLGPDEALLFFVRVYPVWRSGQRARLITSRTQDRNLSPGSIIISHRCVRHLSNPITGMAQRKRAGLITSRSLVQTQLPVFVNRYVTLN